MNSAGLIYYSTVGPNLLGQEVGEETSKLHPLLSATPLYLSRALCAHTSCLEGRELSGSSLYQRNSILLFEAH